MKKTIIRLFGKFLAIPAVAHTLFDIAKADPDEHILAADGSGRMYMYRYWLFNRITNYERKYKLIPFSIRIHRIMLPDTDRHMHDHPFNARTFLMLGGYDEVRQVLYDWADVACNNDPFEGGKVLSDKRSPHPADDFNIAYVRHERRPGDSCTLGFNQYHSIERIIDSPELNGGGVLTFFAFGKYLGKWGFDVDGTKVPHAEYKERKAAEGAGDTTFSLKP